MAVAYVQQADSTVPGTTSGTAFSTLSANTTVGNWLALAAAAANVTSQTISAVSGLGVWAKYSGVLSPAGYDIEWWACRATSAGKAITVSTSGGSPYIAYVAEFSGVGSAATGGTVSTTGTNPALGVSQVSGEAVLVAATFDSAAPTAGPSSPWTDYNTGQFYWDGFYDTARMVSASSGTATATWTAASGGYGIAGIILSAASTSRNSGFFDLL